jgi:hypothetical protein
VCIYGTLLANFFREPNKAPALVSDFHLKGKLETRCRKKEKKEEKRDLDKEERERQRETEGERE